jgi:hypothetical protein
MAYKIEKGIAIPPTQRKRTSKYPWADMKTGDSFFVPGKPKGLYAAAKQNGLKIAVRPEKKGTKEGVRVWKVADIPITRKRGRPKKYGAV